MKKTAGPDISTMLGGIGSWGAIGAGAGALGMGAAHALGPNTDHDPNAKKRSLLKSMLLGGALGGATGAGARAFTDWKWPDMATVPGSGVDLLGKQAPPPVQTPYLASALASYPQLTGPLAGIVGAASTKPIAKALMKFPMNEAEKIQQASKLHRLPGLIGLGIGSAVYTAGKSLQEPLAKTELYNQINQTPDTLRQAAVQAGAIPK